MPSTVVDELAKPICALPSSTPRTLAMPAPGVAWICKPGTACSHMFLSAPPSGTHEPPCGPVIIVTCWAAAGSARATLAARMASLETFTVFIGISSGLDCCRWKMPVVRGFCWRPRQASSTRRRQLLARAGHPFHHRPHAAPDLWYQPYHHAKEKQQEQQEHQRQVEGTPVAGHDQTEL